MTYLTYNVREYFELIKSLSNTKVLDFGCNHANFLINDFDGTYIGLDIDQDLLAKNKLKYPQHKWVHYKNYNYQYNCDFDIVQEWPVLDNDINTVIAFSVFTHTDFTELSNTAAKLQSHLSPGGDLLLTFFSSLDKDTIRKILLHRDNLFNGYIDDIIAQVYETNISYVCVNIKSNQVFVLTDIEDLPKFSNDTYFLTFYNDNWLKSKMNGDMIDVSNNFTDIRSTQKCLKLSTPL